MGFINYHGTKENRYEEVIEHAKIQNELERQRRDELQKQEWFAMFSGEPRYAALDSNSLLKIAVKHYRDAADIYRKVTGCGMGTPVDALQLWQDLWMDCTSRCISSMEISEDKVIALLQVITGKVLKLDGAGCAETHFAETKTNRKYQRYLKTCFSLEPREKYAFWGWLSNDKKDVREVERLAELYEKYSEYFLYYLYKSIHPKSDQWMNWAERNKENCENLSCAIQSKSLLTPDERKLRNPIYQESGLTQTLIYTRIILFNPGLKSNQEGNMEMIEDLYEYLQETSSFQVETIIPKDIEDQIQSGILPEFENASISGLQPGEKVHFIDHAVCYKETKDATEGFIVLKGTFAVTNKRVAFRAAISEDLLLSNLDRVTQYDSNPEILEISGKGKTLYMSLPNQQLAYQVLRMLSNSKNDHTSAEVKVPFTYEQLVEKADIDACIFSFECLETYSLPQELTGKIALLVVKLKGLKKALENHPDRQKETERFMEYYLPEAVRLITSYSEYQDTAVDDKTLQKTYERVTESIDALDSAVEQRILSIYNLETMETRAKADALRQILEQDGYIQGSHLLKL
ncbi:MAG: 5-bromo-4-chloroindolyl phosphate hydrolysis family protein [Parasporobacterium sp.]|nr:5-bromo-4-chloroindolyl phosphate hydrolysis family protein [Parasporobacterium sp.]